MGKVRLCRAVAGMLGVKTVTEYTVGSPPAGKWVKIIRDAESKVAPRNPT
jgi:hypothetical protein